MADICPIQDAIGQFINAFYASGSVYYHLGGWVLYINSPYGGTNILLVPSDPIKGGEWKVITGPNLDQNERICFDVQGLMSCIYIHGWHVHKEADAASKEQHHIQRFMAILVQRCIATRSAGPAASNIDTVWHCVIGSHSITSSGAFHFYVWVDTAGIYYYSTTGIKDKKFEITCIEQILANILLEGHRLGELGMLTMRKAIIAALSS